MPLQCDFLVAHCIDYRLQGYLNEWLENNFPAQSYDRVAIAGFPVTTQRQIVGGLSDKRALRSGHFQLCHLAPVVALDRA
jgi:hypothetical protein